MTTVNETAVKSTIKQDILDLSASLTKVMTIDSKTGSVTVEPETYVKLLPEGLSKEQVIQVQDYNSRLAAAAAHAVGMLAIPVMKKNKDLDRASMSMGTVGKDTLSVNFDRSRQVPSRDEHNQPNGTKAKFGSTSVQYDMYSTSSKGELLKVKKFLGEQATSAFGS